MSCHVTENHTRVQEPSGKSLKNGLSKSISSDTAELSAPGETSSSNSRIKNDLGAEYEELANTVSLSAIPFESDFAPDVLASHDYTLLLIKWLKSAVWVWIFSYLGLACRIGLSHISSYPGAPVFPLIWSQFLGCSIAGYLVEDTWIFPKVDRYNPLYTGILTGFCGSVTTFSGLFQECMGALLSIDVDRRQTFDRPTGLNILALLSYLIISFCVGISSVQLGRRVAMITNKHGHRFVPQILAPRLERKGTFVGLILFICSITTATLLSVYIPSYKNSIILPLNTAPLGASLRFLLSLLNEKNQAFPLGTFSANVSGTFILAIFTVISGKYSRASNNSINPNVQRWWQIYNAISHGFCGSLTTFSTFLLELQELNQSHSWRYAIITVSISLLIIILIEGTYVCNVVFSMCLKKPL